MTAADTITVLGARGQRLTKVIHADGTVTRSNVKFVDLIERPLADLAALERLLRELEPQPELAVCRGAPADPGRTIGVRRIFHADPATGEPPTIIETKHHWLSLDFDDVPRPKWVDFRNLPACAAVAAACLPTAFKRASLIVQATTRHGLTRGLRLRLWFWLDRPVSGAELKWWLRDSPIDDAVFIPNQIIITAVPLFRNGATDPLAARLAVIPGAPVVEVAPPDQLQPPPPPPKPVAFRRSAQRERDISGLVRVVVSAPSGHRNKALFWAACRIGEDQQIDQQRAVAVLRSAALSAGLSSIEVNKTIESALRGHQ